MSSATFRAVLRRLKLPVLVCALAGCAMASPTAPSGPGGKADGDERVALPQLSPAYTMAITSHVVTEDADGERAVYDSRIDGFVRPFVSDEGISLEVVPCHVELPEADGRKPKLDDATVRERGPVRLPTIFTEDQEGRISIATETGALELGVALDDPLVDELPEDRDDPHLIDHDADDEVGVTIDLDGWEIYLAARARIWLSGTLDADTGVMSGDAELTMDVEIYGDDIPFVDVRSRVEAGENGETEIIEVANGFTLTPLDEVPLDCGALDR